MGTDHRTLSTSSQLGHLLAAARRRGRLSQRDVADQLGLSQSRVSHLESHPDEISFKQLLAWCAVVGLALELHDRLPGDGAGDADRTTPEW